MIDTKVVLVLVILLGTLAGGPPPAGGVPIPQAGVSSAR